MDKKILLGWKNTPAHLDIGETNKGIWLLVSREDTDETCISIFTQRFHRAPEHIIPGNWVKFVGPVTEEEARYEED